MESVVKGSKYYHMVYKVGEVSEVTDNYIIVKYNHKSLRYSHRDIDRLLFKSEDIMYTRLSKALNSTKNNIKDLYHKNMQKHLISNRYYQLFDYILDSKQFAYYRFIYEALEMMIAEKIIDCYSSFDKMKVKKYIEAMVERNKFKYAINLSFWFNSSDLTTYIFKSFCLHQSDSLDQKLLFFRYSIKCLLNEYKQFHTNEITIAYMKLFLKQDYDDFILLRMEEELIDQFVDVCFKHLHRDTFVALVDYTVKFIKDNEDEDLNNKLFEFSDKQQNLKDYLGKYYDLNSRKRLSQITKQPIKLISREERIKELNYQLKLCIEEYQITELIHFTKISNVPSIIKDGFCPRKYHSYYGIESSYCDDLRLDNRLDCTCFSISYPNYNLLYSKRRKGENLCILVLSPALLYETKEDKFFYCDNAASTRGKRLSGKGIADFHRLFDINHRKKNTPINYPTNSQAEILVEGIIDSKYIEQIHAINETAKNQLLSIIEDVSFREKVKVSNFYFNYERGKEIWEGEADKDGEEDVLQGISS